MRNFQIVAAAWVMLCCGFGPAWAENDAAPLTAGQERALKPKDAFRECENCPEMVVVPAGAFTMGAPEDEAGRFPDEGPQHVVTIGRQFAVARFHVTRDQFAAFVNDTGYQASSECSTREPAKGEQNEGRSWRNPGFEQEGSHPVVCVTWDDANAYVNWVANRTGKPYRLLSEAEFEYAARGQTAPGGYPRFWFGNDEKDVCQYANGAGQEAQASVPATSGVLTTRVPAAAPHPADAPLEPVITVQKTGQIWVGSDAVDKTTLIETIRSRPGGDGSRMIYVRIDKAVPSGDAMAVLALLEANGLRKLSLVVLPGTGVSAHEKKPTAPATAPTARSSSDGRLVITVDKTGQIWVGSDAVDLRTLIDAVRSKLGDDGSRGINIRMDKEVPYGDVAAVLGLLGENGFRKVGVISPVASVSAAAPEKKSDVGHKAQDPPPVPQDADPAEAARRKAEEVRKLNEAKKAAEQEKLRKMREAAARKRREEAGDDLRRIEQALTQKQGWQGAPCNDGYARTSPVGHYAPNAFGLFDMAGNAWQYTADCKHVSYDGAPSDGSAWTSSCTGSSRVVRGGSWVNAPTRAARRFSHHFAVDVIGFRLARTLE